MSRMKRYFQGLSEERAYVDKEGEQDYGELDRAGERGVQVKRPKAPPKVEAIPSTPMGVGGGAARTGKGAVVLGRPNPIFDTVGTFDYLKDLVPNSGGARVLSLQAQPESSAATTVAVAYDTTAAGEQLPVTDIGEDPALAMLVYERDHTAFALFGSGGGQNRIEFDVTEGGGVVLPGSYIQVGITNRTFARSGSINNDNLPEFSTFASGATNTTQTNGTYSEQVYAPFAPIRFDIADPPTISQWQRDLLEACINRTLQVYS